MSQRKTPAPQDRRSHRITDNTDHSRLYRREDGYSAPTGEDRAVREAVKVLQQYGYGIAMRCVDCQHPITSAVSLTRMRGPRCAARRAKVVTG